MVEARNRVLRVIEQHTFHCHKSRNIITLELFINKKTRRDHEFAPSLELTSVWGWPLKDTVKDRSCRIKVPHCEAELQEHALPTNADRSTAAR